MDGKASVVQWKHARLLIWMLWVRIPSDAPSFFNNIMILLKNLDFHIKDKIIYNRRLQLS